LFRVSFPAVSFAQQEVAFRENVMVLSQLARVGVMRASATNQKNE
jgi:hypothetical protein